jgi:hypothetical protein
MIVSIQEVVVHRVIALQVYNLYLLLHNPPSHIEPIKHLSFKTRQILQDNPTKTDTMQFATLVAMTLAFTATALPVDPEADTDPAL